MTLHSLRPENHDFVLCRGDCPDWMAGALGREHCVLCGAPKQDHRQGPTKPGQVTHTIDKEINSH